MGDTPVAVAPPVAGAPVEVVVASPAVARYTLAAVVEAFPAVAVAAAPDTTNAAAKVQAVAQP